MNKQIDDIYQQVIDEDCANPLYRFAELVEAAARKDEREECAKLCEENMFFATGEQHAKAIRQRGEK